MRASLLKWMGLLLMIGGAVGICSNGSVLLGGGVPEVFNGSSAMLAFCLVLNIIQIAAGALGFFAAKRREIAKLCIMAGAVLLAATVVFAVLLVAAAGAQLNYIYFMLLPLLYGIAAVMAAKKEK